MEFEKVVRIPDKMFFNIAEVSRLTGVKDHVLRYWESQFSMISPDKSRGNRRLYTKKDVESILLIKELLYKKKFSIEGARRYIVDLRRNGELKSALVPHVTLQADQVESLVSAIDILKRLRERAAG